MAARPHLSNDVTFALNMGKQSRAGALGILIFDHLISIELEVNNIWSQRWSWGHSLYLFNRWLAAIWLAIDLIPFTSGGITTSHLCDDIVTLATTLTVQTILMLRVWAVYESSHRMLLFLLALCAFEMSAMAAMIGVTIAQIGHWPVLSGATGCWYSGLVSVSAIVWTPALIVEPILALLILRKAFEGRFQRSGLFTTLARDSLIYFVAVFIELLISTVVWARYPTYINMVMPWSTALPSLFGSRLILNMRQTALSTEKTPSNSVGISHSFNGNRNHDRTIGNETEVITTFIAAPIRDEDIELAPYPAELGDFK